MDALQRDSVDALGSEEAGGSFEAQLRTNAAALAEGIRSAREREMQARRDELEAALAACQTAFHAALEQQEHWEAAAALRQLRDASEHFHAAPGADGVGSFSQRTPAPALHT